jgi:biopolymer transport protein ExbD
MVLNTKSTPGIRAGHRRQAALVLAVVLQFVLGCAYKETSVLAKLEVSDSGEYKLDGKQVEANALHAAVSSLRKPGKELYIHLVSSPRANYESVRLATEAAQQSGAKIGIVGNERY